MGCVREFAGQVLTGEVQLFVQVSSPFGAIGHIVNNTFISNEFACAALACIAAQFHFGDDVGRNVHRSKLYRVGQHSKEKSPDGNREIFAYLCLSAIFLTVVRLRVDAGVVRIFSIMLFPQY